MLAEGSTYANEELLVLEGDALRGVGKLQRSAEGEVLRRILAVDRTLARDQRTVIAAQRRHQSPKMHRTRRQI